MVKGRCSNPQMWTDVDAEDIRILPIALWTNKRCLYFGHRLLPTHPHLASADFIRLLPVATSAHPRRSAHPFITHSHQ